ncbi:hypothetical protein EDC32_101666 [Laceyella sacchari]|nr:hypothetical protein EDC32_101666 [Laceyella sacchari]
MGRRCVFTLGQYFPGCFVCILDIWEAANGICSCVCGVVHFDWHGLPEPLASEADYPLGEAANRPGSEEVECSHFHPCGHLVGNHWAKLYPIAL